MPEVNQRFKVKVALTEAQRKQASEKGYVFLSARQAARIRGKITAAGGAGRPKGQYPMCGCGCGLTYARAVLRHPSKAVEMEVEEAA